jgi:Zn-dependent peptidase ImmA (M78 family)
VGYRRGFKTEATAIATEVRSELGLGLFDPLDPYALADHLAIPILGLSVLAAEAPQIGHLLTVEPDVFSAVTVFAGTRRTIVHNDGHSRARQNSNLCHELSHGLLQHPPTPALDDRHELSHGLLQHPPTPALDDRGCRIFNQGIEDEATWLAGCLLLTEQAAMAIARGRWTRVDAAEHFGVSEAMIRFRINKTGAAVRIERATSRYARR